MKYFLTLILCLAVACIVIAGNTGTVTTTDNSNTTTITQTGQLNKVNKYQTGSKNNIVNGERIVLLSGANSGGKTTLLVAIAVITILAQMGFPVPCEYAIIGGFKELHCKI